MRSASIIVTTTLSALALSGSIASANVLCQPAPRLQELIAKTNAKPVFMAQSENPDFSYVIIGDPVTGEWIAFALSKKAGNACSVANGFNFSIVAPKQEPAK